MSQQAYAPSQALKAEHPSHAEGQHKRTGAPVQAPTALSVIVPTRNEAGNIAPLVERLAQSLAHINLEIIFVDDSDDGTVAAIRAAQAHAEVPIQLLHRLPGQRADGLGGAVLAGLRTATMPWICVMDADLQHPPELIPAMLAEAERSDSTLVVASRYCARGSAAGLSQARSLVSRGVGYATRLAFPRRLKSISDPMSGFFLVHRDCLPLDELRPRGFKILLEIVVRSPNLRISEVGFAFGKRHAGVSKASLREGMRFLHHLCGLRFAAPALRPLRFLFVGASGLLVNMLLLALATEGFGLHYLLSAVLATQGSTLWNFVFSELWVFNDRQQEAGALGRLTLFLALNNAALLLRGPLLVLLISILGVYYLLANLVSLVALTALRYGLADGLIWRKAGRRAPPRDYHYDIHGIISVSSTVWLPELERFLCAAPLRQPTIRVRTGTLRGGTGLLLTRTTVNGQRLCYSEGAGPLGFGIDLALGSTIEVVAAPILRWSPHVLYTNVVEPILRWSFVQRGYALVHGACISFGDEAFLVTARTDTGKTTTILRVLDHQRRASDLGAFLSDDLTLLRPDGQVLTYPKPLTISHHTVAAIHTPLLSRRERLGLLIQSRLHSRSGRRFAMWLAQRRLPVATINTLVQLIVPPPKYHVQRLVPHVHLAQQGRLRGMIVIERGGDGQTRLDRAEALEILLRNCDDAYGFPPYHTIKDFLHGQSEQNLPALEREIIAGALHSHPTVLLQSTTMDWSASIPAIAADVVPALAIELDRRQPRFGGPGLALEAAPA